MTKLLVLLKTGRKNLAHAAGLNRVRVIGTMDVVLISALPLTDISVLHPLAPTYIEAAVHESLGACQLSFSRS
jgi:hypothetical protein